MTDEPRPPLWIETAPAPARPPLDGDSSVDVCVVGAGIVGLTAAHALAEAGRSVAVLERGRILEGVTGKTTAKVTLQHGLYYDGLVRRYGAKRAAIHVEANRTGQQRIADLVRRLKADAAWTKAPSYVYTTDASRVSDLRKEAEAAAALGLPAAFTEETELPFATAGAVRFDGQYHFHPRRYLVRLAEAAEKAGATIHEQTPVLDFKDGEPCVVRTDRGTVRATHVVVATHVPINEKAFYTMRMQPRREYVVVAESGQLRLEGMYVNCDQPRRSVRPYEDLLVFAGDSHPVGKDGETWRHYEAMESFARTCGAGRVTHKWSTQDSYPTDEVPLVGRYGPTMPHVVTATGFRAWGMTMGTAAGLMLADLVLDGESPWSELYDPFSPVRAAKTLAQKAQMELVGTAVQGLVGRRLKVERPGELEPGEGRVVTVGLEKVAVCRDRAGAVHAVSARCTHMGCIVGWNEAEQSWDCPCHGSRFGPDGRVLHGPAATPLGKAQAPDVGKGQG